MATQLNIKDEQTVRLIKEYAAETGRTVTATVKTAIENDRRARAEELQERLRAAHDILKDVRKLWKPETEGMTLKQIMDSIYDEEQPDGFAN